ncbi:MAG: M6 family metalloprotease domain-containing protein [Caldilineaceae bacterium]
MHKKISLLLFLSASLFCLLLGGVTQVRAENLQLKTPYQQRLAAPDSFGSPIPRTGDQKLLVLLVDFPDLAGKFSGASWFDRFFGNNSFASFYNEVSYQQLRYSGTIVGLSAGIPVSNSNDVAYIRLPNPITYYADGNHGFTVGPQQFPKNSGGVVYHALQALDTAGFDFSPYADPGSNRVENLIVIFAGSSFAATRDNVNSLEATAYSLNFAGLQSSYTSSGGQVFDNYTFCPDQRGALSGEPGYIGICAHEHGHGLGMPDLYDYGYTTSGAGKFDLMAYGNAYSDSPFHFGAFSKQFYGWVTPTVLATGSYSLTLGPVESGANVIKLFPNGDSTSQEYFLLENRQVLGFDQDWITQGLCSGLVIWHIDRTITENGSYFFGVNSRPPYSNAPPHPGVTVVEADGDSAMIQAPIDYGQCADLWQPGRTWDATSLPSSNLWTEATSKLAVKVVASIDNSLVLSVTVGDPVEIPSQFVFLPLVVR